MREIAMSQDAMTLARAGFEAWRQGDFEAIEAMLDPEVKWHAFEPGEWDCHNRADVMATIRQRYSEGFAAGQLEFVEGGSNAVIVVAHPRESAGDEWPEETATVIRFQQGRVVDMQDYRSRAAAVEAQAGPG
jgi:ketosteroid isomerase-like protein